MSSSSAENNWTYEPVPTASVNLFRMCWQLETWFRTMVYVELRAARLDWEEPIKQHVHGWPPSSLANDKRLHHMATPHQAALSYLTFGELWSVISANDNWNTFSPYFPPKDNAWERIKEVKGIRNRVAHFRESHPLDTARLKLFLQDMEPGIRRFCSRYTTGKIPRNSADDPVSEYIATVWEQEGYGIELLQPSGWLYAPEPNRMAPQLHARLEFLPHSQYSPGSQDGVIYRVVISPSIRKNREINIVDLFQSTKRLHHDIIHFTIFSSGDEVSVTIPAIHGTEKTAKLVLAFLSAGVNAAHGGFRQRLDKADLEWPEYVVWPDH